MESWSQGRIMLVVPWNATKETCNVMNTLGFISNMTRAKKKKKKKMTCVYKYRHEYEPVGLTVITAFRYAVYGVMPPLGYEQQLSMTH